MNSLKRECSELVEYFVSDSGDRYIRTGGGAWYCEMGDSWEPMFSQQDELEAERLRLGLAPVGQKTLDNSTVSQAKNNVPDLKVVGDGDMFKLLCKASSESEGWMKSTKACEVPNAGCIVQVTTQQGDHVAEALTWIPGVRIAIGVNGGNKLVSLYGDPVIPKSKCI